MNLPSLAIRNSSFTVLIALILALFGLTSYLTMPRSEDPQIDFPGYTVVVIYPGAAAEDLEAEVVDDLEEAMNELRDIDKIQSSIQTGVAVIQVDFFYTVDPDEARNDVVRTLNQSRAAFPDGVIVAEVIDLAPDDVVVLQYALVSEAATYRQLKRQSERLEELLESQVGIKRADTWGYAEPEVRIAVDLEKLGETGVTLEQLTRSVEGEGRIVPGGDLDAGRRRFNVRTSGDFGDLREIGAVVVGRSGERLLRVRDVAEVEWAAADEAHLARSNGERSVFVTAVQRRGTNLIKVSEGAKEVADRFGSALPDGMALRLVWDQSVSVETRLSGFTTNLLQGVTLVGFIILLALGLRAAVLVMVMIPLSILIALGWVDLTGYALQQISIAGFIIALGLLVDNAIVVQESIGRYRREGLSGVDAAVRGASEVQWAVLAGTVTTVFAFFPLVLVGGGAGEFLRSLPVTIIYTLLASLLLAMILSPVLAARFGGSNRNSTSEYESNGSGLNLSRWRPPLAVLIGPVARGYESILARLILRPWRVLLPAVALGIGGYALFPMVGVSFFPASEKPEFLIDVEGPEDWSLAQTDAVVREIEQVLDADPDVVSHFVNVGRGNPRIYYNIAPERERANVAQIVARASDRRQFDSVLPRLREALAVIPDADIRVKPFLNGPPVEAPVAVKIVGPDLDAIFSLATEIETIVRDTEGTRDVRVPLLKPRSDLLVSINREKAGLLGVPVASIDQAVRAALEGVPVGRFRDAEGETYAISVELDRPGMPTPEDLDRIRVTSLSGEVVPLRQLAEIFFEPVLNRIDHYATIRSATVTAEVQDGVLATEVIAAVRRGVAGLEIPEGHRVFMAGEAEELGDSFTDLLRALLLANLAIFAVLVLQFRSLVQPLIILVALPLAIPGSIIALLISGYTFSFFAFVGLTALAGVVINNAIILIDTANRHRESGAPAMDAVIKAAGIRLYPIVLTTLTTIAGLLPLTLQGSDLWSPLGWTIIGGMICSTLLTLIVVPLLYGLVSGGASARR